MSISAKAALLKRALIVIILFATTSLKAQVIISQYYEGGGTNKWIELTNLGNSTINTASPQLRLGLWSVAGSTGNINIAGAPQQVMDLSVVIPAKGSVLIGNPANGTEVPYLTSASASQVSNQVINFNGNDGIALLDNANNIIDQFGQGINATDRSYYRNLSVTGTSASFNLSEWTLASLATVQAATIGNVERLNYHLTNTCAAPTGIAANMVYYTVNSTAIGGAFTPSVADEYLVLISTSPIPAALPQDGVVYQPGDMIGGARVINRSGTNVFYATGLSPSTTYYFFVFSLNSNCMGGPAYLTGTYFTASNSTASIPVPQAFNNYFGNLHAHSSFSDGNADNPTKTPADDYAFAKGSMCMDFLGISEHNHTGAGMSLSRWQPGRDMATAATTPSFVAMYGMEWGVIEEGGHSVIYGMDSLMGWEAGQYQVFVARGNYAGPGGIFEKINQKGGNAFVYLAHPELTDFNNIFLDPYANAADNAIVGTAIESGPANSTSISYNTPGSNMAYLDYYKILLSKGYHVGPAIDHDNHNMTFGRTARTRLAIVSPELTEQSLLSSMKQMRFYATQDCNAHISFTIAGQQLGAVMVRSGSPQLDIQCQISSPVTSLKIMGGTPGNGSFPAELANFTTGSINYTDATLSNFSERYYYLDITEADGSRIITAPIWYSRVDGTVASGGFTAFNLVDQPNSVLLRWTTLQEENNAFIDIERSTDGARSFTVIGTLPGKGATAAYNHYSFTDVAPFAGMAYYRLRLRDHDGSSQLSMQRLSNRSQLAQAVVNIYPNPVKEFAAVHLYSPQATIALIDIVDISGRRLLTQKTAINSGEQVTTLPVTQFAKGTYVLRITINGQLFSKMLHVQ